MIGAIILVISLIAFAFILWLGIVLGSYLGNLGTRRSRTVSFDPVEEDDEEEMEDDEDDELLE